MRGRCLLGGIAARIALACLVVSATAIVVIAVGVLGFGQSAFQQLMMQHGATAGAAHQMFQQTVTAFFVGAALMASSVSILFAVLLARRLSQPLDEIGRAARRVAEGDYHARVPRAGPEGWPRWRTRSTKWPRVSRSRSGCGVNSSPTRPTSCALR